MSQLAFILVYLCLTVFVGILTKKSKNAAYFEGHKLGLLMCVAIGAGEWMGGTSTTGVSEYGYLYGISGAWYTIANGLGICFLGFFFARLFRRLNTATVPGIIGVYLGEKARKVSSVILTLVLMIVGVSQMISVGTLGQSLFGLNSAVSILVLGAGVLIYTVSGGMNAIGSTNVLHLIVMYGGMLIALVTCITRKDGTALQTALPASYFSPVSIGGNKVSSWIIASVLGACTAQAGLQPILKSKDEQTASRASFFIALIVAPFGIITALLGMYAKVLFPELQSAKLALPSLLQTMNPAVSGLVMAAILAAVLSTASPIFLSCGTLITRDFYMSKGGRAHDDKQELMFSRGATLVTGIICILASILLSSNTTILDIVYFAYSLRGSLFVVLMLGIFWRDMKPNAAIGSMIVTTILSGVWIILKKINGSYPIPWMTETYIAVLTTLVTSVGFSLLMRTNDIR